MNILLSSVGRRAYLVDYFKSAVAPLGGKVLCTNTSMDATGMIAADIPFIVPYADSPEFIPALLNICGKNNVSLLFSLHDWESLYIAKAKAMFEEIGTLPVMPDFNVMKTCLDKYATINKAKELGINTPATFLTRDELKKALDAKTLRFPIIIKPRCGQGSLGLFKVNSWAELTSAYELLMIKKSEIQLNSDLLYNLDESGLLFQECIDGVEYGCDIVNDLNGNFATTFVKMKTAMRSGETDGAETVNCPQITDTAEKISSWSKHPGNMDADFIINEYGKPVLLDLNPRFGGGYPFSHAAGADIPGACISWRNGKQPTLRQLSVDIGIRAYKAISMLKKQPCNL